MRFLLAFGCLPVPVFYVNDLPLAGQVRIYGIPIVLIEKRYEFDIGLHHHELEHVERFWREFPFYYWRNKNDQAFRLHNEATAYARQLKFAANPAASYIHFLAFLYNDYDFDTVRPKIKKAFDDAITRRG